MNNTFSKFFKWNFRDFLNGLIMAILGAVSGVLIPSIENLTFTFEWHIVWKTALSAASIYLIKNLLSNSQDKFLKSESSVNSDLGGGNTGTIKT